MDLDKIARLVDEGKNITAIAKGAGCSRNALYKMAKTNHRLAEILANADRKVGHPSKDIDYVAAEKVARLGCTNGEIATFCDVSLSCFNNHMEKDPELFAAVERGRNHVKMSIRHGMLQMALPVFDEIDKKPIYYGNATMLIWLCKLYIGNPDRVENSVLLADTSLLDAIKAGAKEAFKDETDSVEPAKPEAA
jgi:hypothetical protein